MLSRLSEAAGLTSPTPEEKAQRHRTREAAKWLVQANLNARAEELKLELRELRPKIIAATKAEADFSEAVEAATEVPAGDDALWAMVLREEAAEVEARRRARIEELRQELAADGEVRLEKLEGDRRALEAREGVVRAELHGSKSSSYLDREVSRLLADPKLAAKALDAFEQARTHQHQQRDRAMLQARLSVDPTDQEARDALAKLTAEAEEAQAQAKKTAAAIWKKLQGQA